jgi:hypothetical protein
MMKVMIEHHPSPFTSRQTKRTDSKSSMLKNAVVFEYNQVPNRVRLLTTTDPAPAMSSHDTETNTAGTLTPASKRVKLENAVAPEDAVIEESSTELNVEGCVVATALETHEMAPEIFIKLTVSWQGRSFAVELCESDR